jgi:hypothetical protein
MSAHASSLAPRQLRQLCHVGCDPPRVALGETLGRKSFGRRLRSNGIFALAFKRQCGWDGVMRPVLTTAALATIAAVILTGGTALAQDRTNSGNYMLPFCKTWLRMQSGDMATITNELSTGSARAGGVPLQMVQAGMCAGEVIGIAATLSACIPKEVTKEQLVRVVVDSAEKNPANMQEDFSQLAAIAIAGAWPCHK